MLKTVSAAGTGGSASEVGTGLATAAGRRDGAELFEVLAERFDRDTVARVGKGEFGGDVLHQVLSPSGLLCGTILWESKRTKNWSEGWLAKLRQDQRAAKADIAVIVSHALPKGVTQFDLVEGVYVVSPQCVLPVATLLRKALLVECVVIEGHVYGVTSNLVSARRSGLARSARHRYSLANAHPVPDCYDDACIRSRAPRLRGRNGRLLRSRSRGVSAGVRARDEGRRGVR